MSLHYYTKNDAIKSLNDVKYLFLIAPKTILGISPLDLLIALILYLSTDAKPHRASLPPALSSWRAFDL
jgi:hypothetical protein